MEGWWGCPTARQRLVGQPGPFSFKKSALAWGSVHLRAVSQQQSGCGAEDSVGGLSWVRCKAARSMERCGAEKP